jgi:integrase
MAPWKRNHPGSMIIKDARFWLPLLALFTGMRLEEIAQLRCRDIRQVDGVRVIDVNASDGKRLKNQNSQRLIPIHSELLEVGLLDRIEETIVSGHEHLWPELRKNKHGSYSASYSNWFGRYKNLIGLTDPKKTFHSFRHTFIDRLKQLDVPDGKIQELVGHANHSITTGRYGKPYRPVALKEVVEALDYKLDLRALYMVQGLAE